MGGLANDLIEVATLGIVRDPLGIDAGEEAAKDAAAAQTRAGREAISSQEAAQARLEEGLQPFVGAGEGVLGQLVSSVTGGQPSPGEQASAITGNPFFQALAQDQEQRLLSSQAARGKLGSGETGNLLTRNLLTLGNQFQRQGEQDRLNQINNLFGLAQIGQSSAAQTGTSGINTAQNVGNLITQIGNSQAAGKIGAQIPQQRATEQIFGLLGSLGGAATGAG